MVEFGDCVGVFFVVLIECGDCCDYEYVVGVQCVDEVGEVVVLVFQDVGCWVMEFFDGDFEVCEVGVLFYD